MSALKNYVVLYRHERAAPADATEGFQCFAEDVEHAKEQCRDAYPRCEVLFTWYGPYGSGMEPALEAYWARLSLLTIPSGSATDKIMNRAL